jgi:hypothetical protein
MEVVGSFDLTGKPNIKIDSVSMDRISKVCHKLAPLVNELVLSRVGNLGINMRVERKLRTDMPYG